jgi:hypothetical protein
MRWVVLSGATRRAVLGKEGSAQHHEVTENARVWGGRLGSLSGIAQRVGGMNASSTSRRAYANEATAAKNRGILRPSGPAKVQGSQRKLTEHDGATPGSTPGVVAHID